MLALGAFDIGGWKIPDVFFRDDNFIAAFMFDMTLEVVLFFIVYFPTDSVSTTRTQQCNAFYILLLWNQHAFTFRAEPHNVPPPALSIWDLSVVVEKAIGTPTSIRRIKYSHNRGTRI
jgi:hypothetical protein